MPLTATLGLPYGAHPRQRLDVFVPDGAPGPLLCCIDGSWWADGRCEAQRGFALLLAEQGVAVANLGHRPLGDGARTGDEILADLAEAAGKALEEAGVLGFNSASLALLGHGSGALTAFDLAPRLSRKHTVRAIAACGVLGSLEPEVGLAPPLRAACDRYAMARHRDHSPLHQDAAVWPAVLLLHGEADAEIPPAQARAMHERAQTAGIPSRLELLPQAGARFAVDALAPAARTAAQQVAAFLAEQAGEPAEPGSVFGCKG